MKIKKLIVSLALSLLLIVSFASAMAITAPYWPGYPLYMNPGDSISLNYDIQNMVGEEDIVIEAEITEGSEIASLTGSDTYTVKINDGISIPFTVTIPRDAELGSKYMITASFHSASKDINKPVQLSAKVIKSFEVFIGEPKKAITQEPTGQAVNEKGRGSSSTLMIILLVVVIVVWLFLRNKKGKK
ncbi:MAG TPA: hypothetical protein VJB94_03120 [Candidatus Nanoarchaeia archaeon]|nr:hypothetical protein [Candidatus Nanoarchaeia archaeon]